MAYIILAAEVLCRSFSIIIIITIIIIIIIIIIIYGRSEMKLHMNDEIY
jgi:hypothetical protein